MRGTHPERRLQRQVAEALSLQPGETLLIAASGGADSTALAALSVAAAERTGAKVVLGHVNHALREAAWRDEGVVLAAGVALGARVLCTSIDPGDRSEASLRERRYAALVELARSASAVRVATAHHARDQAETVLLALFRGTGLEGLRGMETARPLAEGITLVRPLLRVAPEDLYAYCLGGRLPFARDASNEDPQYRRNAVRAALEPLREAFPRLDEAVARCAEIARQEASASPRARLRAQLRRALERRGAGLRDVTFERLEAAARAIEAGASGRVFIKQGVELKVNRG